MRPTPMAPTLMRLLGAIWPKTDRGTMVGNPATTTAPDAVLRKLRRETLPIFFMPSPLNNCVRCALLRANHQLRGKQALCLVLRRVRPVHDVGDKLRPKRQRQIAAVDVARLFRIHDEQMVSAL